MVLDFEVQEIMMFRFILLLTVVTVAITVTVNQELQSNLTIRVKEQNSNSTGIDNDKRFWEWLFGSVPLFGPLTEPQQPEECLKCTCGLTNKYNRIIGGVETLVNQYPWMVLLMYKERFYCGGSVINSRHVLTAAHCTYGFDASKLTVRILEHHWNSTSESETQDFQVEKIIRHSGYSTINYDNDIALLKLKNPIKFQNLMRPVCLPEQAKTFAGKKGIVTGWGAIKEGGSISHSLQEVEVPILTNTECRMMYPSHRITDNMLCAGYKEGGKDSCQGDSGGPLHVEENGIHQLVGVVSWGEGCAQPRYPGVYARVNRYHTWITRNTENGCFC